MLHKSKVLKHHNAQAIQQPYNEGALFMNSITRWQQQKNRNSSGWLQDIVATLWFSLAHKSQGIYSQYACRHKQQISIAVISMLHSGGKSLWDKSVPSHLVCLQLSKNCRLGCWRYHLMWWCTRCAALFANSRYTSRGINLNKESKCTTTATIAKVKSEQGGRTKVFVESWSSTLHTDKLTVCWYSAMIPITQQGVGRSTTLAFSNLNIAWSAPWRGVVIYPGCLS